MLKKATSSWLSLPRIFLLATLFVSQSHAIPADTVKKNAVLCAITCALEIPLLYAYQDSRWTKTSFFTQIQDLRYWAGGLVFGAIVGGLYYYFAKQYTAEGRYESALQTKEMLESSETWHAVELSHHAMNELFRAKSRQCSFMSAEYPFMSAVDFFYCSHICLQYARRNVGEAIQELNDLNDNDELKQKCENLLPVLERMIDEAEVRAAFIAKTSEWFNEINRPLILKNKIESTKWVIKLTGGTAKVDIFETRLNVTFGKELAKHF